MRERTGSTSPAGLSLGIIPQVLGGLAFIVPAQLPRFSALQITLGRYLAFGLLSLVLCATLMRGQVRVYDRAIWKTATLFGLSAHLGYYFLAVLGVQLAGASVTALIIGTLPVTVALYGNWRRPEYPLSALLVPVTLILIGLVLINLPASGAGRAAGAHTGVPYLLGLACATAALALWTWYAVANAAFLSDHPTLSASAWTSLVGITTLAATGGVLAGGAILAHLGVGTAALPVVPSAGELLPFLIGILTLGLGASWAAGWLWNWASRLLPIPLAGQLIVCEPLTVLVYVFAAGRRLPTLAEVLGIALIIGGVLLGVRASDRTGAPESTDERYDRVQQRAAG